MARLLIDGTSMPMLSLLHRVMPSPITGRYIGRIQLLSALVMVGSSLNFMLHAGNLVAPAKGWELFTGTSHDSTPAVGRDGTLYFGTFSAGLMAIDSGGTRKWVFPTSSEIWSSPAIGEDGTIYFGCRNRNLYAISSTGKLKWKFPTQGWVDASPALAANGNILVGSWDKSLHAVTGQGHEVWSFATGGPVVSSAAIDREGNIYFGSNDGNIYSLTADGKQRWAFSTRGAVTASPALSDEGQVYCSSGDGFLYALTTEGTEVWRVQTRGYLDASPVIGQEGRIFVGGADEFFGVSAAGKIIWRRGKEGIQTAPVVAHDGMVVCLYGNGQMFGCDQDRTSEWTYSGFPSGHASPVILPSGRILVMRNSAVFALEGNARLAGTAWPKFRGNSRNTGNLRDRD
jgi:outer membrane protein assembly factor BamB